MATTITKLFRTGILQSSVEFDEITYTIVKFATDGVYASEFDEVTMDGTASGGSLGTFTEIAPLASTGLYPLKIVIDSAGKFLYAAMQGDRTIIQYEIDQVSGELTQIGSPVSLPSAPAAPADIGIDPTGRFLYVTNSQLNLIRQFSINQTTGTLTQISSDISTNAWPFEMAFDLEGKYVYICNLFSNNISQYIINQTTGLLTKYADWSTTSNPRDITIDPTGKFLYVAQGGEGTVRQFSINQANGELTQITTDIPSGNTPVAITVSPSGQFAYAVNFADSPATISQYSINQSTGALSFIANIAVGGVNTETSPTEFIIDPTGSFGYVPRAGTPFGIKVFSINQTTGTLTLVYDFYNPVIPVNFYSFNAAIHPTGQFLYATLSPDGFADFPHGITQYKIDFSTSTSAVAERRTRDGKLLVSGYFDEVDINNPTPTPSEPIIGEPYGGGYYAGVIVQGGEKYRVIVAPKATGETSPIQFNGLLTAGAPATKTLNNGPAASAAWAAGGELFDAATFCENLNIGGYTDWYLPSRDELELCYRNLKPTTAINFDFGNRPKSSYVYPEGDDVSGEKIGRNRNSDPEGADYVSSNTLQTSVEIFKSGESEAFNGVESGVDYYHYYWSSSEYASEYCWAQSFSDGYQAGSQKQVFHSVRAVRRELISVITAVIPSTLSNIDRDQSYTVTFSVTGGTAPYTFSVISGSLPPGLNLSTLGTLSGTPTLSGTYNFTIRIVDSEANSIQQAYSLVVETPIEIITTSLSNFIAAQSYSEVLIATGGDPDYTFTVDSGELPTGITLEPTGNLVGIPFLSSLIISPQDLPDGVNGVFYDERITASDGVSPYVYSLDSGSLPTGLTLSSTGTLQGLIQVETPNLTLVPSTLEDAINNSGYTVTLSATGGVIPYAFNIESGTLPPNLILNANGTISGTVSDNLVVSPSSLPGANNGDSYTATITASNGEPPYTFAVSYGSLPLGLAMDANGNITGVISE